jgi:hypothetical protein
MTRRRIEYLVIPSGGLLLRPGFPLRLLVWRWKAIALAFLVIAGPVLLAMWIVPYSASTIIEVNRATNLWGTSWGHPADCGFSF